MALKSLIVGLLVLAIWARSYSVGDVFRRGSATQFIELGSAAGNVIIRFGHDGKPTVLAGSWSRVRSAEPHELFDTTAGPSLSRSDASPWRSAGFGFHHEVIQWPIPLAIYTFLVPHWLIFILAIPSAILWVIRKLRAARGQPGAIAAPTAWCPACCMELRTARMSCPRCGGPVASAAFGAPSLATQSAAS